MSSRDEDLAVARKGDAAVAVDLFAGRGVAGGLVEIGDGAIIVAGGEIDRAAIAIKREIGRVEPDGARGLSLGGGEGEFAPGDGQPR